MVQVRHHLLLPAGVGATQVFDLISQVRSGVPSDVTAGPVELDAHTTVYGPDLGADGGTEWRFVTSSERGPVMDFEEDDEGLLRAFPHGVPVGAEARVVDLVLALARRLRGQALLDSGGRGLVVTPTPRLDLTVWSEHLLTAQQVLGVVAPVLPSAQLPGEDASFLGLPAPQEDDVVLSDEQHASLHAAAWRTDVTALGSADEDPERFAVIGFLDGMDDGDQVSVEVHPVEDARPPALGAQRWCYDVVWSPMDDEALGEIDPSPAVVDDARSARVVVHAVAQVLVEVLDGVIVDADGFLVDRYSLG